MEEEKKKTGSFFILAISCLDSGINVVFFALRNCWHLGLYDSIFHCYEDECFLQDSHLNLGGWRTLLSY